MSNIRRGGDASTGGGDIEAPKDVEPESFSTPPGATHNPVFLARIIFRKVVTLLTASDEEDITQPAGIVTIFRDVVIGIILGVLVISISIFLDHINVIHLQSAHNFRNSAFKMLNDPETIQTLEESSDLHFMTSNDYETRRKEIEGVAEKMASQEELLAKREKELEEKQKEIDAIKDEHDKLSSDPRLGLEKWCGECVWNGRTGCVARLQYLKDTYNTGAIIGKVSLMDQGLCKKEGR